MKCEQQDHVFVRFPLYIGWWRREVWSREQSPRASRALETRPAAREARARGGGREGGGRCDSREDLKISSARGLLAVWCGGRTGLNMDDCTRSRYLERAATRSPWRWLEQPTGASGRDTSGPNHYTLVFNVNSLQPVGFYSFHGVNKPWHRLDSGKLISLCGK